jgi:hypothetical protein
MGSVCRFWSALCVLMLTLLPLQGRAQFTPVLTAAGRMDQSVYLRWTSIPGSANYRIYWATSSPVTTSSSSIFISGSSTFFHLHTGLTPGTLYYYAIEALDASNNSTGLSPEVSALVGSEAITPVTGGSGDGFSRGSGCQLSLNGVNLSPQTVPLRSYSSQGQILLGWPVQTGLASYSLERMGLWQSQWSQVASGTLQSFLESPPAVTIDSTYRYRLTATLTNQCILNPSDTVLAVAMPEPSSFGGGSGDGHSFVRECNRFLNGTHQTLPAQPLTIYSSENQILVSWPEEAGATSYTVERTLFQQNNWSTVTTAGAGVFSFLQTSATITPGQVYEYRVLPNLPATFCPITYSPAASGVAMVEPSAYPGGAGDGHSTFKACQVGLNGALLASPSQAIISYPSQDYILLAWPSETNAALYVLERSPSSQNLWTTIQSSTALFADQQFPAIVAGTTYDYRVRVQLADLCWLNPSPVASVVPRTEPASFGGGSGDGFSGFRLCSSFLNGTQQSLPGQSITVYGSESQILVAWPEEAGATSYTVERTIFQNNNWSQVFQTPNSTTFLFSQTLPAVTANTVYEYRVRPNVPATYCPMTFSAPASGAVIEEPAAYAGGSGDGHSTSKACEVNLSGFALAQSSQLPVAYPSMNGLIIAWPTETNALTYVLERSPFNLAQWTSVQSSSALFATEQEPGINIGVLYDYRVRVQLTDLCWMNPSPPVVTAAIAEPAAFGGGDGDGHGFFLACDMFLDGTPGGIPSQPFVSYASQGQILLSWPAEVNVSGYDVQRSLNLNGPWTNLILNTANTFFADADPLLVGGQQYYYRVKANNLAGCPLAFSVPDSAIVRGEPAAWGGGNGDGHSGFRLCGSFLNGAQQTQTGQAIVVYSSESQILISWPEEIGASTYTVERSLATQNSWTQVFQTPNATTFFFSQSVPAVVAGQQYDYRVRPNVPATYCPITFSAPEVGVAIAEPSAYPGGAGDGHSTSKACDMGLNGVFLAPASQALISYLSQDNILLAWPTETNAALYVLERSPATLNQWTQVQNSNALFGQESVPAIVSGTSYDYRVRVQLADLCWMNPSPLATVVARPEPASFGGGDGDGHGFFLACDMFLDGTPGGIPSQPFISYASQGQILLSWPVEINVSGYDVQRSLSLNGPWSNLIVNTANTFFTDTDPLLVGGQQYYYRVKANNLAGCALAFSLPDSVVVRAEPAVWGGGSGDGHSGFRLCGSFLNGTQQTQPGQSIVVYSSESQILVSWPEEIGASTYTVERSLASQNSWTQVFQTPNATTFLFSQSVPAVVAGQQYDYRVRPNVPASYCPITFSAPEVGVAMAEPSAYLGGAGDGYATYKACDMGLNGGSSAPASQALTSYLSQDNILLSWSSESNASVYVLERSLTTQNQWTQVQSGVALFGAESVPAIVSGTTYDYRVRVQLADLCWMNPSPLATVTARPEPASFGGGDGDGHGFFRACDVFLNGTPGGIPSQSFIIYASQSQTLLGWPAEVNVSGYDVQRSLSLAGPWSTIASNTVNLFFQDTDPLLVGGQKYYYQVRANNLAGCPLAFSAPDSAVVIAEPLAYEGGAGDGHGFFRACDMFLDGTPGGVPSQSFVIYTPQSQILLSWPAEINVSGYDVQRSLNLNGPWSNLIVNTANTFFTDTDPLLVGGQQYFYRVKANNLAGCPLAFSTPDSVVVRGEPSAWGGGSGDGHSGFRLCGSFLNGTQQTQPGQSIVVYSSESQILVSWPEEIGASTYTVERSLASQNSWTQVFQTPNATTFLFSQSVPAVVAGQQYDYRVRPNVPATYCPITFSAPEIGLAMAEPAAYPGGAGDGYATFKACDMGLNGGSSAPASQALTSYLSQDNILLSWSSETNASVYVMERSLTTQNQWTQVQSGVALFGAESVPAIVSGTTYDYRVRVQLADLCWMNPSPLATVAARPEPASFGGGDGDGHGFFRACDVFLNGTPGGIPSQSFIIYASQSQTLLGWPAEVNVSGYDVQRSLSLAGPWSTVASNTVNLFFQDTDPLLVGGQKYYYQVRANNLAGCPLAFSTPDSAVVIAEPLAYEGGAGDGHGFFRACDMFLDGTPGGIPSQSFVIYTPQSQILLSWPAEINVSGYDVQRSLNLNGPWSNLIVNTANTFFTDTDPLLVGGQQYFYRVKANNLAGCPLAFSTPDSVVVRGEPSAWGGGSGDGHSGFRLCGSFLNGTQQTQPGQPIVVYSSESQILLTWPEEIGASTYTVERSLASQNSWTQVFQTPNATTFLFSQSVPAVVAGQQYDYRVRPNVPATYCPITFSAPEIGVAMAEPAAYPGGAGDGYATFKACDMGLNGASLAPASQALTSYLSQDNILLSWSSETNASVYVLERSLTTQNQWTQVQSGVALFGAESVPAIVSGTTYDYRVRVQLADLCWMNPSPIASVVARTEPSAFGGGAGDGHGFFRACDMFLDGTPGGIPSQAFITYASQNQVLLSWPVEVNVSGYDVQRSLNFNGPWTNLIVNTANTFFPDTDPLLVGGQQYFYRVKANNLAGCPLAFSLPDSAVVRAEPVSWGGGSGDGHSGFRLCNTFINGTQQTLPGQQPTVYSSEHQILVSWPEEIGASTYTVERSLSNQNTWTQVFQTPNSTTFSFNQTLPSVLAGTVYDYRVRPNVPATYCPITFSLPEAGVAIAEPAAYPGGAGDGHATFKACEYDLNGVPLAAPSQALTGYPSMEELLISWPSETNGSVYILERSLAGQNIWIQVQNGPGLFASETPTAIQSAILYDYRVRVQLNDLCWLNPSPITSIVARPEPASFGGGAGDGYAEFRLCNTLLDGQSQLIAGAPIHIYNQHSQILLTWPSQFAAVGYTVERSDFQQNNWSQVFQTANPAVLSFQETEPALTSGIQYDYRVRPDLAATSCPLTFSPASTAVAMAEPASFGGGAADGHATSKACQVLLNGQNLSAASQPLIPYPSMESILVAWNSEANAINYVLERSDAGLNQWQQVSSGLSLFGSDAPPQIASAVPYDYRVRVQLTDLCWMNPTPLDSVIARPEPASFGGGAGDGHARNITCALLTLNHGTILITGSSPACTADSLLLTAANAASYQWFRNDTIIAGATSSTFYPQQNGDYKVVLTGLFACTVNTNEVPLTINPTPATPSGATAFPSLISCGPVALTAPTPPPGTMFYWQTQFNSQVSAIPADTVFIVSTPGYYYLNAFDSLGCWSLSSDSIQVLSVGSPTEVANASETGTCIVPGLAGWNFFIGSDGRAIAAIQEQGDTLGSVTSFVYVTGQPSNQFDGTHEFLGRHWLISPTTQPANPVTLRLYFSQAELDSFFLASQASPTPNDNASVITDLRVIKYSGPTEDNVFDLSDANSVETLAPIGSGSDLNGLYIDVQITAFSEFWISGSGADGNGPLPITVLSNSLTCSNSGVSLQLNTATEINNLGFVIQRSPDMAAWDSIGWIPGAGTAADGQLYNYNDSDHPRGGAFYRWLQVDTDGSLNPTQALWINCQEDNGPRIVWAGEGENGGIDVRLDWDIEENLSLGLYDMSGRLLSDVNVQIKDGVHQFQVAKNRPSSGLYVIRASGNRGDQHLRFVVTGK